MPKIDLKSLQETSWFIGGMNIHKCFSYFEDLCGKKYQGVDPKKNWTPIAKFAMTYRHPIVTLYQLLQNDQSLHLRKAIRVLSHKKLLPSGKQTVCY